MHTYDFDAKLHNLIMLLSQMKAEYSLSKLPDLNTTSASHFLRGNRGKFQLLIRTALYRVMGNIHVLSPQHIQNIHALLLDNRGIQALI